MITDFQAGQGDIALEADLCIVGSGPAGLTLASEFAGTRYRVVVLEAGGFEHEKESQALYQGQCTARPYGVATSRLRMFGGTSGHWSGQCTVFPERHMRQRPGITDARWPAQLTDLAAYCETANHLLELGEFDYDQADVRSREFGVGARSEGLLAPVIFRYRPGEALRFGTRMRGEMERAANVHVLLHANVKKLITNAQASHVNEVQFATLDGRNGRIRARSFVLACGGLETPRLLLNTDSIVPAGLGNRRGLVGRYFMDHPNAVIGTLHLAGGSGTAAMTLLSDRLLDHANPAGSSTVTVCLGERVEREQRIGGGCYRFMGRATTAQWLQARSRIASGQGSFIEWIHAFASYFDEWAYAAYRVANGRDINFSRFEDNQALVFVEFEQLPDFANQVSLTGDVDRLGLRRLALHWKLGDQAARTMRAMGDALGREAHLRGWGRFRFEKWVLEDNIEQGGRLGYSSHHIGTTRMADDEQFGVVNPDGRLFDCDNLYVAGSAVFPTSSFANPTLTITALAFRLADHLKRRLT
jgi:choline dehydrogenase-like flavoprotein